jgi:hypothetical protein
MNAFMTGAPVRGFVDLTPARSVRTRLRRGSHHIGKRLDDVALLGVGDCVSWVLFEPG